MFTPGKVKIAVLVYRRVSCVLYSNRIRTLTSKRDAEEWYFQEVRGHFVFHEMSLSNPKSHKAKSELGDYLINMTRIASALQKHAQRHNKRDWVVTFRTLSGLIHKKLNSPCMNRKVCYDVGVMPVKTRITIHYTRFAGGMWVLSFASYHFIFICVGIKSHFAQTWVTLIPYWATTSMNHWLNVKKV